MRIGLKGPLERDFTQVRQYRSLAAQMRQTAKLETDRLRQNELLDLALHYNRLADDLIAKNNISRREPLAASAPYYGSGVVVGAADTVSSE